ncbi:MAG: dihydromonapterin reductase [Plesiomonas sp.]|uniref:dihydromonapterin reductase n=1 Tax=Plesiomonas sp. TaxID=2486279 RepID=UPI003F3E54D8
MPLSNEDSDVIIITGGAKRIGYALTRYFLQQQKTVIISYRTYYREVDELTALGTICICADFSTDQGIESFYDQIMVTLKKLNKHKIKALIHNASEWKTDQKKVSELSIVLNTMMQIHVKAPYLLNMLLETYFDDHSDIIHFTDYVVEKGSDKHIAYAASKAALENLTLSFAKKLAPFVKVNAIAPALIMFNTHDDAEYKIKALNKSLMGIVPGEIEIIKAVQYLLDSHYVTGRILHVDGGRHLQ